MSDSKSDPKLVSRRTAWVFVISVTVYFIIAVELIYLAIGSLKILQGE